MKPRTDQVAMRRACVPNPQPVSTISVIDDMSVIPTAVGPRFQFCSHISPAPYSWITPRCQRNICSILFASRSGPCRSRPLNTALMLATHGGFRSSLKFTQARQGVKIFNRASQQSYRSNGIISDSSLHCDCSNFLQTEFCQLPCQSFPKTDQNDDGSDHVKCCEMTLMSHI